VGPRAVLDAVVNTVQFRNMSFVWPLKTYKAITSPVVFCTASHLVFHNERGRTKGVWEQGTEELHYLYALLNTRSV